MKQYKLMIMIVLVVFIFTSCSDIKSNDSSDGILTTNQIEDLNKNIPKKDSSESTNKSYAFATYSESLTINEAIKASSIIIKATFIERKQSEGTLNLFSYKFKINEVLKGEINEKEITVNIFDDVANIVDSKNSSSCFEPDEKYILMLYKFCSVYSGDSYSLISGYVTKYSGTIITQTIQYGQILKSNVVRTIEEFSKAINENTNGLNEEESIYGISYTKSTNASEIIEFSPIIVRVKILKDVSDERRIVNTYEVETVEILKGEFPKFASIDLFKNDKAIIGEECLILIYSSISESSNEYFLSSANSYIPISETEKYEEYMQYINK